MTSELRTVARGLTHDSLAHSVRKVALQVVSGVNPDVWPRALAGIGAVRVDVPPESLKSGQHSILSRDGAIFCWCKDSESHIRIQLDHEAAECVRASLAAYPREMLCVDSETEKALKKRWAPWLCALTLEIYGEELDWDSLLCAFRKDSPCSGTCAIKSGGAQEPEPEPEPASQPERADNVAEPGENLPQPDHSPTSDAKADSDNNSGDMDEFVLVGGRPSDDLSNAGPVDSRTLVRAVLSALRSNTMALPVEEDNEALEHLLSPLSHAVDAFNASALEPTRLPFPLVTFESVEWSNLRHSGPGNRVIFGAYAGNVLTFAGDAADACATAIGMAIRGAGDIVATKLCERIANRQACENSSSCQREVKLRFSIEQDTYIIHRAIENFGKTDAWNGLPGTRFRPQVMHKNGTKKSGTKLEEWFVDEPERYYVMFFDVSAATRSLVDALGNRDHAPMPEHLMEAYRAHSKRIEAVSHAYSDAVAAFRELSVADTDTSKTQRRKMGPVRRVSKHVVEEAVKRWSSSGLEKLRSLDAADITREIYATAHETLLDRVTLYLRMVLGNDDARIHIGAGAAYVDMDDQMIAVHDLPLAEYYGAAAAAHAALSETRAEGYISSVIVVDGVPYSAQAKVLDVFQAFAKRNPTHTVVMTVTHPDLLQGSTMCMPAGQSLPRVSVLNGA
jgi:hypothetical protein